MLISKATGLLVLGIVLLYVGAEALVEAASRLSVGLGVDAAVAGVTVVAFATTMPELFVGVLSGLGFATDMGIGAVIGSNIANLGLVLGIAALIRPLSVDRDVVRRHVPFMIAAAVLVVGLGYDGVIGPLDGLALLGLLGGFTWYLIRGVRAEDADADPDGDGESVVADGGEPAAAGAAVDGIQSRDVGYLAGGLALLFVGSRALITGGRDVLIQFGFSYRLVGLTVLAFGTSLPELAASVVAAVRGQAQFSVGNVVGSNIYNVLAVVGVLALMVPIRIAPGMRAFDFPALLAFTVGAVALMLRGRSVSRIDGALLVAGYAVFFHLLL
ncbi:MAG: calcium/sodium antiporter [Halolamina sp.]